MTQGQFLLLVLILVLILVFIGLPWMAGRRRGTEPWDPAGAYLEAIDALLQGRRGRAVDALRGIARRESDDLRVYLVLGDLVRIMGHPEKAQRIHAGLASRPVDDPALSWRVKESLLEDAVALGRWDEVLRLGGALREADRKNPVVLRALVRAHEARGDWEAAFAAVDEWDRTRPGRTIPRPAQLRVHVAGRHLRADRRKEARRLLEEALRLDPEDSEARLLMGDVLARDGEHEKAAGEWLEFARRRPDRAHVVFERLERSYYELGRFGDLVQVYERLIQQSSDPGPATVALAEMHQRRGRSDEAKPLLEALLASRPDHRAARRLLVAGLLQEGRTEAAAAEIDTLLRTLPDAAASLPCPVCGFDGMGLDPKCSRCGAWRPRPVAGAPDGG